MNRLPAARPSPRIAGGALRWYAGDTFSLTLQLELTDQDGEEVAIGASDSVTVSFYDRDPGEGPHVHGLRRHGRLREADV